MAEYDITPDPERGITVCHITGRVNALEGLRIGEQARRVAQQRRTNLLYDVRDAQLALSLAELYDLARKLDIAGIPRVARVSILTANMPSDLAFYETTAHNVGHDIHVFDDETTAYGFACGEDVPAHDG